MADAISFDCPSCGKHLKAGLQDGGKLARCPKCGTTIAIPEGSAGQNEGQQDKVERLFAAVKEGNVATAEAILKTDPSLVAAKDEHGSMPLYNAAHLGQRDRRIAVGALLLGYGADVNAKNSNGNTPLLAAADYAETVDWLKLLLSHGADVNCRNSLDSTPLHLVAVTGSAEAATVLVAAGADVNARNTEEATPVSYAAKHKPDVLKVLLAAGARPSHEALRVAAEHGRLESVKLLLDHGVQVNPAAGGYPPLRWAACGWSDDHVRIAELLLAHGADPHIANRAGRTPLASAEHNRQLPAMIELLRRHMRRQ